MSWLALTAMLASTAVTPVCSWDRPGHRAFMGDVVAAVDHYQDIPPAVRARLKQRMAARRYDEIATIERDAIVGRHRYTPELREMHFAQGQICGIVKRDRWPDGARERGLVYCETGHCLIVPTVCRNIARITREPEGRVGGIETEAGGMPGGVVVVSLPPLAPMPSFAELSQVPPAPAFTPPLAGDPVPAPGPVALLPAPEPDGGAGSDPPVPPVVLAPDPAPPVLPPEVLVPALVPEPAAALMLLCGVAVVAGAARRRRARYSST